MTEPRKPKPLTESEEREWRESCDSVTTIYNGGEYVEDDAPEARIFATLDAARERIAALEEVVGQVHDAMAESRDSDDETLADGVRLWRVEAQQRIAALEESLAATKDALYEAIADASARHNDCNALNQMIDTLRAEVEELRGALIWCSGSADFSPEGIAHKGWLKVQHLCVKEQNEGGERDGNYIGEGE